MADHKFSNGQIVEPIPSGAFMAIPPGRYEIVQPLPPTMGGDNQYRIKSLKDGHQRIVKQSEMAVTDGDGQAEAAT